MRGRRKRHRQDACQEVLLEQLLGTLGHSSPSSVRREPTPPQLAERLNLKRLVLGEDHDEMNYTNALD